MVNSFSISLLMDAIIWSLRVKRYIICLWLFYFRFRTESTLLVVHFFYPKGLFIFTKSTLYYHLGLVSMLNYKFQFVDMLYSLVTMATYQNNQYKQNIDSVEVVSIAYIRNVIPVSHLNYSKLLLFKFFNELHENEWFWIIKLYRF